MLTSFALAALACAVFALPAFGSAQDVIRDCSEDGVLNHHYSHSELTQALAKLPSDIDEYTDCRAVIRSAQLRSAGGRKGGAPAVTTPASAGEQKKVDQAHSNDPVQIGGKGVVPGASGAPAKAAGFGTDLPPLVLAVLVALGAAMIGAALLTLQRHRPDLVRVGSPLADPFRKLVTRARDGISRFRR